MTSPNDFSSEATESPCWQERPLDHSLHPVGRQLQRVAAAIALSGAVAISQAQDAHATAGTSPGGADAQQRGTDAGERFGLHGQLTLVDQYHPTFRSRFSGQNSLASGASQRETADFTAFAGVRLWAGAEAYVNPELDQGFGLSNTVGVAGYPSGEAYKVGKSDPYLRWNRLFIREVFALGDQTRYVESAANQLAGTAPVDSVTLTAGKFSVPDVFDTNKFAHDARGDFLNWSVIDAGAFDYAADAWGYSEGVAIDVSRGRSSVRGGLFALSDVPNSQKLDSTFGQYSLVAELEERVELGGHPGKVSVLGFENIGRMGGYDAALASARAGIPDTSTVRRYAGRGGMSLNIEQELSDSVGFFARASMNDGSKEAYEFTEINRSVSAGLAVQGAAWKRNDDTVGVALVRNDLSRPARRYFAAGGLGILIGDGALPHYGSELILETYYSAKLGPSATLSADYQRIAAPAYNRDRGPVSLWAIRLHWQA